MDTQTLINGYLDKLYEKGSTASLDWIALRELELLIEELINPAKVSRSD